MTDEYLKGVMDRLEKREPLTPTKREPKTHKLKCWPEHFQAIIDGSKTNEIRLNDRDYRVGDVLYLCEWNPIIDKHIDGTPMILKYEAGHYTGRDIFKIVTYIIDGFKFPGVSPGYVCMSIKEPE